MTSIEHRDDHRGTGGYVVRRPRATDALGESLRNAFGDTHRLPEDLLRSLAALDRDAPLH